MTDFFDYIKTRKLILLITFLFLIVRLVGLSQTFLLKDERDIALTDYFLAKTGKDIYGNKAPVKFGRISPQAPVLGMYYGVMFWKLPIPKTVEMARIIFIIPSTLLPLLAYEILLLILKKKRIALITAAVFASSPWIFHVTRLGVEANLAYPLLFGAILFQLKRKIPLAWLLYGLAFFTYQGLRPFIPVAMIYFELPVISRKTYKHSLVLIVLSLITFVAVFTTSLRLEGNIISRGSSEILFLATERLTQETNHGRFISLAPPKLRPFFDNKITASVDYLTGNILKGFNASFLFEDGDYVENYANGVTGQFFPLYALFLVMGLFALAHLKQREPYIVAGLIIAGMIPSLINIYSLTFSLRSLVAAIGFSYLIGLGLELTFLKLNGINQKNAYFKRAAFVIVLSLISMQIGFFCYRYFAQRPSLTAESFFEEERQLSGFLQREGRPFKIVTTDAFSHFMTHIFLVPLRDNELTGIQHILKSSTVNFSFKGIDFSECNPEMIELIATPSGTIIDDRCLTAQSRQRVMENKIAATANIRLSSYNQLDFNLQTKFYVFK